jgi:hypothetical protein
MPSGATETITAVSDADATVTASSVVTLATAASLTPASSGSHGGGGGALDLWSVLLLASLVVRGGANPRNARA